MVLRELGPERRLPGGARVRVQLRDGGVGFYGEHRGPLAHHLAISIMILMRYPAGLGLEREVRVSRPQFFERVRVRDRRRRRVERLAAAGYGLRAGTFNQVAVSSLRGVARTGAGNTVSNVRKSTQTARRLTCGAWITRCLWQWCFISSAKAKIEVAGRATRVFGR